MGSLKIEDWLYYLAMGILLGIVLVGLIKESGALDTEFTVQMPKKEFWLRKWLQRFFSFFY